MGSYDAMNVDFNLLAFAPTNSEGKFTEYLYITGLDQALLAIRDAYYHDNAEVRRFENKTLGIDQNLSVKEVLNKDRLKKLYDAYMSLKDRASSDSECSPSVKWFLETGTDSPYAGAWSCVLKMFGVPENFYPTKSVSPNYWFCGRKISEFREYMSAWRGDPDDYFCGTDSELGFVEDINALSAAIDAYRAGEKYVELSFITDMWSGESKIYRTEVVSVLSEKRLSELRNYIRIGVQAYKALENGDYCPEKDISFDNLKKYGFTDKDSDNYKVYNFILTEKLPVPEQTKISDILKRAEG